MFIPPLLPFYTTVCQEDVPQSLLMVPLHLFSHSNNHSCFICSCQCLQVKDLLRDKEQIPLLCLSGFLQLLQRDTHTHMLTLTHMLTYAIISWERGCRVKKKKKRKSDHLHRPYVLEVEKSTSAAGEHREGKWQYLK